MRRLRHIKPATSFRSGYAYDNILYTVAGALIEEVSGQTWESYVRDHVFKPAGMTTATSDEPSRLGTANRAYPHGRTGGPVRGLGTSAAAGRERDQLGGRCRTAGGLLAMSANDLAKWLKIQLAHGKIRATAGACSARHPSAAMWNPGTIEPIRPVAARVRSDQADVQGLCARLGSVRIWRRQDHLALRRRVRLHHAWSC